MILDATLQGAFLLAPYGRTGEAALAASLDQEASRDRVLEILGWIGSPASTQAVVRTVRADHDHPTFVRALSFLMSLGGVARAANELRIVLLARFAAELPSRSLGRRC